MDILDGYTEKELKQLAADLAGWVKGQSSLGLRMIDLPDEIFDIATEEKTPKAIFNRLLLLVSKNK